MVLPPAEVGSATAWDAYRRGWVIIALDDQMQVSKAYRRPTTERS
jgi:hypothetical protein